MNLANKAPLGSKADQVLKESVVSLDLMERMENPELLENQERRVNLEFPVLPEIQALKVMENLQS